MLNCRHRRGQDSYELPKVRVVHRNLNSTLTSNGQWAPLEWSPLTANPRSFSAFEQVWSGTYNSHCLMLLCLPADHKLKIAIMDTSALIGINVKVTNWRYFAIWWHCYSGISVKGNTNITQRVEKWVVSDGCFAEFELLINYLSR